MFFFFLSYVFVYLDVEQERTHNALIAGVENFKPSSLKRTDTKEKIVLPNAQGSSRSINSLGALIKMQNINLLIFLNPKNNDLPNHLND